MYYSSEQLTALVPERSKQYMPAILAACAPYKLVTPALLWAHMEVETLSGTSHLCIPKGPACRGDHGHGHGLWQIDDRSHSVFLRTQNWRDPRVQAKYVAGISAAGFRAAMARGIEGDMRLRVAIAGFNAGPARAARTAAQGIDPERITHQQDYVTEVLDQLELLARAVQAGKGLK